LAARFALKKLYYMTENRDTSIGYQDIETVDDDMVRPCCYAPDVSRLEYVSASHDRRYAVAVAGECGVGVDVETMAEVLWRGRHIYMSESEQRLVSRSNLGKLESAVRIWSAKEATAKAFNLELVDAWRRVTVLHVGEKRSTAEIQDVLHDVLHNEQDGHVFSFAFDQ
jgi:phosphopantetheinyl transferase (holo-ACP synthase)